MGCAGGERPGGGEPSHLVLSEDQRRLLGRCRGAAGALLRLAPCESCASLESCS